MHHWIWTVIAKIVFFVFDPKRSSSDYLSRRYNAGETYFVGSREYGIPRDIGYPIRILSPEKIMMMRVLYITVSRFFQSRNQRLWVRGDTLTGIMRYNQMFLPWTHTVFMASREFRFDPSTVENLKRLNVTTELKKKKKIGHDVVLHFTNVSKCEIEIRLSPKVSLRKREMEGIEIYIPEDYKPGTFEYPPKKSTWIEDMVDKFNLTTFKI